MCEVQAGETRQQAQRSRYIGAALQLPQHQFSPSRLRKHALITCLVLLLRGNMKVAVCIMMAMVLVATISARPQQQPQTDGGWVVKTDKTRNGGTVVHAEANKQWDVTNDGKVKAEVHGHWDRTYGGPNNGQRDRGVGGSVGGSWG